jgi:hypothetical protein
MRYALNALPETFINMLQSFVSIKRIERYLDSPEVSPVKPLGKKGGPGVGTSGNEVAEPISFMNATVTWPQSARRGGGSEPGSTTLTPKHRFVLADLNLVFPAGELSLICGKLGE